MAEIQDDKERKKLYGLLVSDPATRKNTAQYSFKQWESKLLGDEENIKRVADYAVKKNWSYDQDDFFRKYAPEKIAKPQPQPQVQAAPKQEFLEVPSLEEQEASTPPPPQPLVGTPEYDVKLQKQYGGMSPTLGATFGGVPASFETEQQKKKEQLSPVFKAQQLAFEDVPIAEEQRKAQRQFAKATKQEKEAALRGGTGFELQQEKRRKERGYGEAASDFLGAVTSGGERIAKNVLSGIAWLNQASMAADPNMPLEYEQRQQQIKDASQRMYDASASSQNQFQEELAKRNIQTSILDAIDKGNYGRIPEATLYTIGDAAMQIIPSILTMGGSTYFQTLPEAYKNGVDAIAKEKGMTPEQVIASGDDALLTAQISSGIQSALERVGAGLVSKSIASRGGYKAMRDWLLKQGVNRNLARGASLLGVSSGEALTEYGQEGTAQIGEIAAKSPTARAFMDKLPKELFTPEATKRRAESLVGGLVGGFGLAGGGQAFQSAMDRTLFEAPKIGKASQRADMDIVQTDNKIQERNKIAQAMEEAVKGNPEAEGQIREQYQKRVNEAAPTDEEVLNAYEGLAALPETEEKNTIRENLEAYMAEKGIQPEAAGMDAGLGEGMRVTAPVIRTVNPNFPPPVAEKAVYDIARVREIEAMLAADAQSMQDTGMGNLVPEVRIELQNELASLKEAAPVTEELTDEEAIQEDEDLASLGQAISGLEQAPVEEAAPEVAPVQELRPKLPEIQVPKPEGFAPFLRKLGYTDEEISKMSFEQQQEIAINKTEPARAEGSSKVDVAKENQRVEKVAEAQRKIDEEIAAEEAASKTPAAPAPKGKVEVVFPTKLDATEVKPYAKPEDNYYRPDQQLKFNQGTYEPVRIIAHPDVIRAMSIGSKLRDDKKRKTVTEQEIDFADGIAKQLGFTTESGKGNAIMLHNAARELAKQNRSSTEERFVVIGEEQGGKKKAAPVTPAPAAPKKEEAPKPTSKQERIKELEQEKSTLTTKALKQFPNSPIQLKTRKRIDEINAELDQLKETEKVQPKKEETPKPEAKEAKPTTGTPQEGTTVEIAPQREGGSPRKMVFKDGEWKQNVGGDIVKVGPSVQQQAQEAFGEKAEAKPAETKAETEPTGVAKSFGISSDEVARRMKEQSLRLNKGEILDIDGNPIYDMTGGITMTGLKNLTDKKYGHGSTRSNETDSLNVLNNILETGDFKGWFGEIGAKGGGPWSNGKFFIASNNIDGGEKGKIDPSEVEVILNVGLTPFAQDIANKFPKTTIKDYNGNIYKPQTVAATKAEFTSKQESSASQEFDGLKKPSKIKTKSFDGKHGKGAFERMKNITDNFEDIMDGMSGKIKQDCL